MKLDEDFLKALQALTESGGRDLCVLLTPDDGQYDSLAQHITIPILVVYEDHESGKEISRFRQIREQDREIALPCRPGGIKDLINLSVAWPFWADP